MKDIGLVPFVLLLNPLVYLMIFPEFEHLWLFLPEVGLHGKVGLW
jgi:hypothetical protein